MSPWYADSSPVAPGIEMTGTLGYTLRQLALILEESGIYAPMVC